MFCNNIQYQQLYLRKLNDTRNIFTGIFNPEKDSLSKWIEKSKQLLQPDWHQAHSKIYLSVPYGLP